MNASVDAISAALRDPDGCARLSLRQWEELIAQGRSANLLARVATLLADRGMIERVPGAPRAHLEGALVVAHAQHAAARREIALIRDALAPTGLPLVLLKGAAYLAAGLPLSRGRVFSDIDILVPREKLPDTEAALMLRGWATTHHHPYDQRYYREWMHELPPMQHVKRSTVIDVHHAILPPTARAKPDAAKLLAAAESIAGQPGLQMLCPTDLVLHSAAHLFYNEVFDQGLRDLSDFDLLLRQFEVRAGFWDELLARADELDLVQPLRYGLRYAARILATPIPAQVRNVAQASVSNGIGDRWMDALFLRALRPHNPGVANRLAPAARYLLFVRGHWLRMPPLMLLRHLTVKALRRDEPEPTVPKPA